MKAKTIIVQANQTLQDIALIVYGDIDGVFYLLEDNPAKISDYTETLVPGTILLAQRDPINRDMVNYYARNGYVPANADLINGSIVVDPVLGDFSDDYNNDYFI